MIEHDYIDPRWKLYWLRIQLFFALVYQINQAEYRTPPWLAWDVAMIIHPDRDLKWM